MDLNKYNLYNQKLFEQAVVQLEKNIIVKIDLLEKIKFYNFFFEDFYFGENFFTLDKSEKLKEIKEILSYNNFVENFYEDIDCNFFFSNPIEYYLIEVIPEINKKDMEIFFSNMLYWTQDYIYYNDKYDN